MALSQDFHVGDYLIDSERIFIISSIYSDRLYYRPPASETDHQTVTGSIPTKNVTSAGFRNTLSAKEIKRFLSDLSLTPPASDPVDPKAYKDLIYQNDPFKLIPLMKQLWKLKMTPDIIFTSNNRDTLESIINHLSTEFSLVTKQPSDTIRRQITKSLS